MSRDELLRNIAAWLDATGVPYMVSGSTASTSHGQMRSTRDIDIVIDPTPDQLQRLLDSIDTKYYVSDEAAYEALRHRSMFNIIDAKSGWKVDLIIRKERPFSKAEFQRRQQITIAGIQAFIVTPEDSILSKLEWAAQAGSDRQIQDAIGVAAVQGRELDREYLERWAAELGVMELLRHVFEEAEKLQ